MKVGVISLLLAATIAGGCDHPVESTSSAAASSSGVYSIALTASSVGALPKCVAALSGTTAYVQSPVSLWSCIANTWVQIPCLTVAAGTVAYSSATQTLLACVAGQWTVVALPQGSPGATGPMGPPGTPGSNGASTLVVSAPESAGSNCGSGGVKLSLGLDTNGNRVLDGGEVMSVSYVCNGAPGSQGSDGGAPDDGGSGQPTDDAGVTRAQELDRCAADADCSAPLVCRALVKDGVKRCTRRCATDGACLAGDRCLVDVDGAKTCLGEDTGRSCTGTEGCNFACVAGLNYCTNACTTGADCPNGWGCMAVGGGPRVCIRYEAACSPSDTSACIAAVACDTSGSLVLSGCTGACSSAADCPQRSPELLPWTCAGGLCRRPADVFGPLGQGTSAAYACNAGRGVNLCNDGQHLDLTTMSVPPLPPVSCASPEPIPGLPNDACVDSCRYQGGCVFPNACVAAGFAGANRVALCIPSGAGEVRAPCNHHADCAFGYCDAGICSRDCTLDGVCPSGTTCQASGGQGLGGLTFKLCR